MSEENRMINTGLRGITVASSKISDVDGNIGKLVYRGYLVKDLADKATFEEIAYLLLYETLPSNAELAEFSNDLAAQRQVPDSIFRALEQFPPDAQPMDILQAAVSMLAFSDPDALDMSKEASSRIALKLIAKGKVTVRSTRKES